MLTLSLILIILNLQLPKDTFNSKAQNAAHEAWTHDPVMFSVKYVNDELRKEPYTSLLATRKKKCGYLDSWLVKVYFECSEDDSIAGEMIELDISKNPDNCYVISKETLKRKCWAGRGHTYYSEASCN